MEFNNLNLTSYKNGKKIDIQKNGIDFPMKYFLFLIIIANTFIEFLQCARVYLFV